MERVREKANCKKKCRFVLQNGYALHLTIENESGYRKID